jgi:hypothetical protein
VKELDANFIIPWTKNCADTLKEDTALMETSVTSITPSSCKEDDQES